MAKTAIIDMDGTIVEHKFPKIGEPLPDAFDVLREMKVAGWRLVLFTCREDEPGGKKYLTEAVDFCRRHGVEFDGVNESPAEHDFRPPESPRRKPYGNVIIDDRNLGGFPGWAAVRKVLLEGAKLTVQI